MRPLSNCAARAAIVRCGRPGRRRQHWRPHAGAGRCCSGRAGDEEPGAASLADLLAVFDVQAIAGEAGASRYAGTSESRGRNVVEGSRRRPGDGGRVQGAAGVDGAISARAVRRRRQPGQPDRVHGHAGPRGALVRQRGRHHRPGRPGLRHRHEPAPPAGGRCHQARPARPAPGAGCCARAGGGVCGGDQPGAVQGSADLRPSAITTAPTSSGRRYWTPGCATTRCRIAMTCAGRWSRTKPAICRSPPRCGRTPGSAPPRRTRRSRPR